MDYSLENVAQTAEELPDSFFIPSLEERKTQQTGDMVRLHFVLTDPGPDAPRAERMWVEISEKSEDGTNFKGYLTNQPAHIDSLSVGDIVAFQVEHIARVIVKKGSPNWVECADQSALVSEMALLPSGTVNFLYREAADREEDSGWRLMHGQETDAYINDPDHIRICNVGWLLDKDPSLLEPLKNGQPGEAYERLHSKSEWYIVKNWP